MNYQCPLCNNLQTYTFSQDKKREYFRCRNCHIIFVPQIYHLDNEKEKKRYDLHINNSNDKNYISFLSRIINPLISYISPYSNGLDFGCGPGPILKKILCDYNYNIDEFDIYFKNDSHLLNKKWDFIVSTEVFEHLSKPYDVLLQLWSILNYNGIILIMTNLYHNEIDFKSWYYKGDPTHISFFSKETFQWISREINCNIEFFDKDIIILKKY